MLKQSLYWAGWVTALALAMWLVFHFLLTRRTARLVHAAEELAEGHLSARSGLRGGDELGRLSRAFDAMALAIAERHRGAQARGRGAACVGSELPGDIRRRRGRDFRDRHRNGGDRGCQSQGLLRVRLQSRRVPATRSRHARFRRASLHPARRDGAVRPCGFRRAAARRMARQEQGRQPALAGGVRQARDHRRSGPDTGARARHHRPQDGRGGVARERGTVPLHVQRVDRRPGAVECRRRDRRYQSRAVADVRLQRRRVLRVAAGQLDRARRIRPKSLQAAAAGESLPLGSDGAAQGRLAAWSSTCTGSRCSTRASRTC